MIKTKIKKAIAVASIAAIATATFSTTFATDIGDIDLGVTYDSDINWDDTYTSGSASGSTSVIVTAEVLPVLNMTLSDSQIDLGTLTAGSLVTGTLDIEIGTNAVNGVSVTARSGSGGLENTADASEVINDADTGERYTFETTSTDIDSTITGFSITDTLASTEVNDNVTEHIVYETDKPEVDDNSTYDVEFTVGAQISTETAAGDYQDTITFTVTGNF